MFSREEFILVPGVPLFVGDKGESFVDCIVAAAEKISSDSCGLHSPNTLYLPKQGILQLGQQNLAFLEEGHGIQIIESEGMPLLCTANVSVALYPRSACYITWAD